MPQSYVDDSRNRKIACIKVRDDRNNIASIGRVLQSTIDELSEENSKLREKAQGRRIFGKGTGK